MVVMEEETNLQQEEQKITQSWFVILIDKIKRLFSYPGSEVLFIAGLRISYVVANFIFMVLITFLTDEWQLKLVQAVIITNVQDGAKGIILIFIASLADDYLGDSMTLLIAAIINCGGLLMLFLTYPSITDKEIKACRERNICEEHPIGILFYLALLLITIGQCGHKNYFKSLKWEEKLEKLEAAAQRKLERKNGFNRKIYKRIVSSDESKAFWFVVKKRWYEVTGVLIAVFVFPHIVGARKHAQLLIRVCMLGVSSFIFIAGKLTLYPFEGPKGSPISAVFQVILVAFKKQNYYGISDETLSKYLGHVDDDCEPQEDNNKIQEEIIMGNTDDLTNIFGFFNKAALYNPSSENPEAEVKNGKLCTVKQVEDAKRFMIASLLSLTFLTYGLIQAVSSTFFVEQANNMDRHFLSHNLPVQVFIILSNLVARTVSFFCRRKRAKPHPRFHGAIRIGLGIFTSCFCFIAAFSVEAKRLQALKYNKTLSAFWLLPQLILMGATDALAETGIEDFFDHEMPDSVSISYGPILAEAITGVGKLLSIVLFAAVNNTTNRHGNPGWFGDRINDSRLDKYYIIMIGFGFISWLVFAMVAILEYLHNSKSPR